MTITDIVEALENVGYTPDEIDVWLASPHPQLNETPHDLIEAGHGDEVMMVIRRLQEGVYL